MEFKKNRHSALGESYSLFTKNKAINLTIPQLINENEEAENLKKFKENLLIHQKLLEEYFKKIIVNPNSDDEVYSKLEQLFKHKSPYNLESKNAKYSEIISKAKQRFELGCPPRKDKDNSIGDSVNWEWIIECAKISNKSIIIVSRDGDYGYDLDGNPLLNDYLADEFRQNAKKGTQIILTKRLTYAFSLVKIPITDEMVKDEDEIIIQRNWSEYLSSKRLQDAVNSLQSAMLPSTTNANFNYAEFYKKYMPAPLLDNKVLEAYQKAISIPNLDLIRAQLLYPGMIPNNKKPKDEE